MTLPRHRKLKAIGTPCMIHPHPRPQITRRHCHPSMRSEGLLCRLRGIHHRQLLRTIHLHHLSLLSHLWIVMQQLDVK